MEWSSILGFCRGANNALALTAFQTAAKVDWFLGTKWVTEKEKLC
jgi:hypothetical protein